MARRILYFKEKPHPRRDYINTLPGPEVARIDLRLDVMRETEPHLWPWVDHVDSKLWKIHSGPHRLFYCLYNGDVVILHAVRKQGWRLRRNDVDLAKDRMERVYNK
jgi:phage-related protein